MFPVEWTQTTSDPPSPTLTAVDIQSPRFGMSDANKQAKENNGVSQDPDPLDLEANRPAEDMNQRDNEKLKRENQHLEASNPAVADTLRDYGVCLVDMADDGRIYIRSNVDDPDNPRNWPEWRRYLVAGIASWLTIIVSTLLRPNMLARFLLLHWQVCSVATGYSTGTEALIAEFDLSEEVGTLGLTLYIVSIDIDGYRQFVTLKLSFHSSASLLVSLQAPRRYHRPDFSRLALQVRCSPHRSLKHMVAVSST